jgi:hypothetical protein
MPENTIFLLFELSILILICLILYYKKRKNKKSSEMNPFAVSEKLPSSSELSKTEVGKQAMDPLSLRPDKDENNRYGYRDREGNWVISPKFGAANHFHPDGSAWVQLLAKYPKYAKINEKGEIVSEMNNTPELLENIGHKSLFRGYYGGFNGLINKSGNWLFVEYASEFQISSVFPDGCILTTANMDSGDFYYGLLNSDGGPLIYANCRDIRYSPNFKLALVLTKNGKWGLKYNNYNWVLEPVLKNVTSFSDNGVFAGSNSDDKWGLIDTKGNWTIEPSFQFISETWRNYFITQGDNKKFGIIDESGKWKVSPAFNLIRTYRNFSLLAVQNDKEKWGFIDPNGNLVVPYKFLSFLYLCEGFIEVEYDNKKWGILDNKGEEVTGPKFNDYIPGDGNDMLRVWDSNSIIGYMDPKGKWKIAPRFEYARSFSDFGFAVVQEPSSLKGVIDRNGSYVVEPKYENIDIFSADLFIVYSSENDNRYFINRNGERKVPFDFNPDLDGK